MAGRVEWTLAAVEDVESLAEFIARDSVVYAGTLVNRLLDAARSLARFPERGRVVPEFADPTVRELLVGLYRLIYRVKKDRAVVIAVIHCHRNLATAWPDAVTGELCGELGA